MPSLRPALRLVLLVCLLLAVAVIGAGCGSDAGANTNGATAGGCDPNYQGACVPDDGYDHNCPEIGAEVTVVGNDPDGLDRDGDGRGCESYG